MGYAIDGIVNSICILYFYNIYDKYYKINCFCFRKCCNIILDKLFLETNQLNTNQNLHNLTTWYSF